MKIAIALLFTLALSLQAMAVTIRVPQDQATIQAGINAAVSGDTVLVSPGTYAEHVTFGGRNIVLTSSGGRDSTMIIQGGSADNLVTLNSNEDSNAVVSGFTFKPSGNEAIQCLGSSPRIEFNSFVGGNEAVESAEVVFLDGGSPIVRFNIFTLNKGWCINIQNPQTHATVTNNTMAKNFFSCVRITNSPSIIKNNIMAFNDGEGIHQRDGSTAIVAYNNVYLNSSGDYLGVLPGSGSTSVDPVFCDSSVGDFALAGYSPCVGTGENNATMGALGIGCTAPVTEHPRVVNISIGDYEDSLHITNHTPLIAWKYFDPRGGPLTKSELEVGSDSDWTIVEMWQPPIINSPDTSITYAGLPLMDGSTYFARVRVHNDTIWGEWKTAPFRLNTPPALPSPNLPPNGSVVTSARPTLRVTNAVDTENDVLHYDFQVFSDSLLNTIVTFASGINQGSGQTGWKTDSLRNENARHWWRSRASDGYETGNWCQPWSFVLNAFNEPPATFGLLLPANGANGQSLLPSFTWSAAADPDPLDSVTYTLAIAIDSNFNFQSLITGISGMSHTLTENLNISTLYWWKVKATDRLGSENWSSTKFRFRTITLGDADGSGVVTISDVVFLINYIFSGGSAPSPLSSGDADCSGAISISDAVYLINYIFAGGAPPCEG